MLHASETWAVTATTIQRLRRNDRAMIRWISNVKLQDEVTSDSLLLKLGLLDIEEVVRRGRLQWFGHVERSDGWINRVRSVEVEKSRKRPGRPKLTWEEVVKRDREDLGLVDEDPQQRSRWRRRLRVRLAPPSDED